MTGFGGVEPGNPETTGRRSFIVAQEHPVRHRQDEALRDAVISQRELLASDSPWQIRIQSS